MPEGGTALAGMGGSLGQSGLRECIKSCETCFAKNALNFLIRVIAENEFPFFPKFYGLLVIWPWLRVSSHSSWNVIYCLIILLDNDWWALPVFLCKLNPIKAHWGTGSYPFSFERQGTFPPQADHVLVDLVASFVDGGTLWAEPPHSYHTS